MKLLLALLAMLTGFSVADGVRTVEPAVAQGQGTGWNAATAVEDSQIVVKAAVYLAAILLPLLVYTGAAQASVHPSALRRVLPTVYRSDRQRQ